MGNIIEEKSRLLTNVDNLWGLLCEEMEQRVNGKIKELLIKSIFKWKILGKVRKNQVCEAIG